MPIYSKSPLDLLCDEINARESPKLLLTSQNVRVRKVEVVAARDISKPNAKVTLTGRPSHGIVGDTTVLVRRLNLATLFKGLTPSIPAARNISFADAARLLNAQYGLNLDPADFREDIYTGRPNFTLTPGTKSIQYYGSVAVTITKPVQDISLLRSLNMSAYNHPVTDTSRKCIDLLSWGMDCTGFSSTVLAIPSGKLANNTAVAALADVLKQHGLDVQLTGGTCTKYVNTTTVTTANKQFDRLVLITGIDDPNYTGSLYLHYNV